MASLNRGLIWSVLPSLPVDFTSVNKAVKWLQAAGKGYHYQTMWHDVSSAFQSFRKKPLQEAFGVDEYLPQKLFVEKDWKRPETYYYRGDAYFRDPSTDDVFLRSYSVYADTSLTDRELSEQIYSIEEERVEEYGAGWKFSHFESMERSHKWGAPRSQGYGLAEI